MLSRVCSAYGRRAGSLRVGDAEQISPALGELGHGGVRGLGGHRATHVGPLGNHGGVGAGAGNHKGVKVKTELCDKETLF